MDSVRGVWSERMTDDLRMTLQAPRPGRVVNSLICREHGYTLTDYQHASSLGRSALL